MNRLIVTCPWSVALVCMVFTIGIAGPPDVTFTAPLAVVPGQKNDLVFHGKDLTEGTRVWVSCTSAAQLVSADPARADGKSLLASLDVAGDVPVGVYAARVATGEGVSPPILFMVDDLPSVTESGKHQTRGTAQPIDVPIAVDGAGDGAASDYYCFQASAGQWFTIEVVSSRLGYALDARLRVYDESGREIVQADDTPGLSGDCRVRFQAAENQRYYIEVGDAAFSSSARHKYRLRVGDFPLVSTTMPLAVRPAASAADAQSGQSSLAFCQVVGTPVPPSVSAGSVLAESPSVAIATRYASGSGSSMARYAVSHLPNWVSSDSVETDSATTAVAIDAPVAINSVLQTAGKKHYYRLRLASGSSWCFQAITRNLGSPADILIKLFSPEGKLLASADDSGLDDAAVDIQAKQDGDYLLVVQEINDRCGSEYSYRIEVTPSQADFELSASADRLIIGQGGVGLLPIQARRSGYKGPIRLDIESADAPFDLENSVIEDGKNTTLLKLVPRGDLQPGELHLLRLVGQGEAEGIKLTKRVSVVDEIRAQRPTLAYPPGELWYTIAVGMAQPLESFFDLRLATNPIQFPRIVGEAYFTVFCTDRIAGFTEPIHPDAVGLPAGFSVSGHDKPVGNSKNSEYRFSLSGPKDLPVGRHLVAIHATGTFQGQVKEVKLEAVPLQVIDPLILTLAAKPAEAGVAGEVVIDVKAKRFVARGGGDRKEIRCTWKSRPSWLHGPDNFVVEAGKNEATIRLTVSGVATDTNLKAPLVLEAETSVQGQAVKVESEPFELAYPTADKP